MPNGTTRQISPELKSRQVQAKIEAARKAHEARTATPTPEKREEPRITPERRAQIEAAARTLNLRAQKTLDPTAVRSERERATARIQQQQAAEFREQARTGVARRTGVTRGGRFFAGEAADAIKQAEKTTQAIEAAGPQPPAPTLPPPEGETETQRLEREKANALARASFFEQQSQERAGELADVSGQVREFGTRLEDFKAANQDAINSINAQIAGLGDRAADMAVRLQEQGLSVDFNDPNVQQQIQDAWNAGGSVDEINARIDDVLRQNATAPLGELETAVPVEESQSIASAEAEGGDRVNSLEEANATASAMGTKTTLEVPQTTPTFETDESIFIKSPAPEFSSVMDLLISVGSTGVDFTSADIDLMKLQTTNLALEGSRTRIESRVNERKKEIVDQMGFYRDFWEERRSQGEKSLFRSRDRAIRRNELESERILAERDDTMDSLARKTARYESFVKAQMEKAGIPIVGHAGMTMLMNTMANWNDSVTRTGRQFDDQLEKLHNKHIDIVEGYVDKILDFNFNIDQQEFQKIDQLTDKWNQLEDNLLLNENQIEMQQTQALGNFFDAKAQQQAEQEKFTRETMMEQQKRMWDLEIEGIKSTGFVPTIGADGRVTYLLDGDGQAVMSLDAQKIYNEMSKGTPKWNPFTEEWDVFDQFGNVLSLGNNNLYSDTPLGGTSKSSAMGAVYTIGEENFQVGEKYTGSSECVGFARKFVPDLPTNLFNINDKLRIANSDMIQPGSVVFFDIGEKNLIHNPNTGETASSGHAAVVTNVHADGTFDVIEANLDGANTISERIGIDKSEIARAADGKLGIYNGKPAQIAFAPGAGMVGDQTFEEFGAGILAPGKLSPQAEAVLNGTIDYKSALTGLKGKKRESLIQELNSADFKAALDQEMKLKSTVIKDGLKDLKAKWEAIPGRAKGVLQGTITDVLGLEVIHPDVQDFVTSQKILGMQITRLFEKGRISDADREFYLGLMPNLRQNQKTLDASISAMNTELDRIIGAGVSDVSGETAQDTTAAVQEYADKYGMSFTEAQTYLQSAGAI